VNTTHRVESTPTNALTIPATTELHREHTVSIARIPHSTHNTHRLHITDARAIPDGSVARGWSVVEVSVGVFSGERVSSAVPSLCGLRLLSTGFMAKGVGNSEPFWS
jgi:hypothetical protein